MALILRAGLILWALSAAACARPGAPSGGPEDKTPPRVIAVFPESLAVNVPRDAEVVVTFDEPVTRAGAEQALWVSPPRIPRSIDVSGATARFRWREPLPESTTVTVLLTTSLEDRRRNPLAGPYQWSFSTGDTVAAGQVTGTVDRQGSTRAGQVRVGLYALADTLPDPAVEEPVAVTEADAEGAYTLLGLPVDGRPHLLTAMLDRNRDREIGGTGEFHSASPESVTLTPETPRVRIDLRLVDPDAPGSVQGGVVRAAGDTVAVWVEVHPPAGASAGSDTLGTAVARAPTGEDGAFTIRSVPPGEYRLAAFCDLDGDGRRNDEPWLILLEALVVEAGSSAEVGEIPGPRCIP